MSIIKISVYTTSTKKKPFAEWFADLDTKVKAIILERIERVRLGNFGDCKLIKGADGLWELRVQCGPGYRIYFGKIGMKIVILLLGGNKGSQDRDITKANRYWLDYKGSSDD